MSVSILHLTDIHAGNGELLFEDNKVTIEGAQRLKQLDRLYKYIKELPSCPDFVVVSGDITIRGDQSGLKVFRDWLTKMINDGIFPSYDRIIICPGNHDVQRRTRRSIEEKMQFSLFWENLCKAFPHAYIPQWDPPLNANQPNFDFSKKKFFGGIRTSKKFGDVILDVSYPFLLDLNRDILIFAFNSAIGCGFPLNPDPKIIEPLEALVKLNTAENNRAQLQSVIDAYLDSLVVDAGMIGEQQLQYFIDLMGRLRTKLKGHFDRLTKIAFLHHHVSHLWNQQLELKSFESVIDAANLKQALVANGFDFVLHGHKHTNHVGIDSALIPISEKGPFTPLCIISGGTVGGYPRINDVQSFKILRLEDSKGPRVRATITEIPIRESANYSASINNDAKIFHAPISPKLPQLHDISEIKNALDCALEARLAPELNSNSMIVASDAAINSAISELVSSNLRYRCHAYLERENSKIFYELLLVTKKLGFSITARLYWLLNDVKSMPCEPQESRKVVILIGSLEGTHFSQESKPCEVDESIKVINEHFKPALLAGNLEIRVHTFSQQEVEEITRKELGIGSK
jgi:3',5'-cyclic AMP phosphodiesterase CpdA